MNELLLVVTVVYGILYGVRNLIMKFAVMFQDRELVQGGGGVALDIMFVVGIIYFSTFGFKFMAELATSIYN
jgi:hypothetical protein